MIGNILRWYGGKYYIKSKIINIIPYHLIYVEPFCGGASVFFNKKKAYKNIINDKYALLINFYIALRNNYNKLFFELKKIENDNLKQTRKLFYELRDKIKTTKNSIKKAAYFLFLNSFTYSGMNRYSPGIVESMLKIFKNKIQKLKHYNILLQYTNIYCLDYKNVIDKYDTMQTFFYFDPPYLPETRIKNIVYKHEMTEFEHIKLLENIIKLKGKWLLSGYNSSLYNQYLKKYKKIEINTICFASLKKTKRVECLWRNY